jgi:hypothetical protein
VKPFLAALAGIAAAVVVILLVELLGAALFPPPAGVDPGRPETLREVAARMPAGALLMVIAAWLLGGLAGGWVAARLAPPGSRVPIVIAALLLAAGVANMVSFPHPVWMWAAGVVVLIAGPLAGARLGARGATART